jgi:hypothetical protein
MQPWRGGPQARTIAAIWRALVPTVCVAAVCVVVVVSGATVAGASQGAANTTSKAGAKSGPVWLCRPGMAHDPCTSDLTTTVEARGEPQTVAHDRPASDPPVDCFYLYPNITGQQTPNAALQITKPEIAIAELEAAPFSQVCRVFAPVYRSATGHSARSVSSQSAFQVAYASAKAAWEDYLAQDNHGRGVVLLGHSEGASVLQELLAKVIDPDASEQHLLVSAILPGTDIPVPQGVPWGPFVHTPVCTSASQSGCVVTYNAYSVPPAADSTFGRTPTVKVGSVTYSGAYCTNPASLSGGSGLLTSLYRTRLPVSVPGSVTDGIFGTDPPRARTGTSWVELDDEYSARCSVVNGADVLEVTALPGAPRLAATPGSTLATFGLHVDDPNLALGNLVDLVRAQSSAYADVTSPG